MRFHHTAFLPLLFCLPLAAPARVSAQSAKDVKFTTATKTEFGGRLGRVMRAFRRGGKTITETTWIAGPRLRTDIDKTSSVIDAKVGTMMTIEHEPRTYWLFSDSDPLFVVEVQGDTGAAAGDSGAPARPTRRRPGKYTVNLSTEKSGERATIAGMDAEQVFLTMRIDGETYNEEADSTERGSFVVLSEIWQTRNFPPVAARHVFDSTWAARTTRDVDSAAVAQAAKAMEDAYREEPRLRIAMMKLDSALKNLSGHAIKTFSHFVAVPDGAQFDREKVLRDAEKGLMADVASSAANNAMNQGRARLGRMTGGRLGGARAPTPEQSVLMRTRYEVTELLVAPITIDKFQPPPGYKRRTPGDGK